MFVIVKNGKYTVDFSGGSELTGRKDLAEYYFDKKSAAKAAREYGKKYGSGFSVKEVSAPAWVK